MTHTDRPATTPLDDHTRGLLGAAEAVGEVRLPAALVKADRSAALRGLSATGTEPVTTVTSIISF